MVTGLCRFLAARPRRSSSALATFELLSRSTDAGSRSWASPAGPRLPGPVRRSGTMTFVARRQLSPVLPCAG